MEDGRRSLTAIFSATMRAAHLVLDDAPTIFRDELALRLAGFETEEALRMALETLRHEMADRVGVDAVELVLKRVRANQTIRHRFTEEALDKAVEHGVRQYVILGAGLDSFAYRRGDLTGTLRVFEIDHPSNQDWKRLRLCALQVDLPSNLHFVPVDFEGQTLSNALSGSAYRFAEPVFFSWLGVTPYLTRDATFATLQQIASLASGTEIVFEFNVPDVQLEGEERRYFEACEAIVAARGEPWLSSFEPDDLLALLQEIGFGQCTHVSPDELNARYCSGRLDGLRTPQVHHLMKAVVK